MLVHGAWHGAWCWDRLVPELLVLGNTAITVDLPVDDGSATFVDYADRVIEAMTDAPDDAIVVGHSLAGMVLPLVADRRSIDRLAFLCAVIPNFHGMPWDDVGPMGDDDYGVVTGSDGAMVFESLDAATRIFYPDCSPEDAAWAFARLRPLRNGSLWDRPYPLSALPPDTAVSAITCVDDHAIYAAYQRAALGERFGVTPVDFPGGHSPFLSRPAELASVLDQLAQL